MTAKRINLYFSHEVEQLAQQLVQQVLAEQQGKGNPLEPSTVIVPNANMQRYLQLYMSESTGISANIEFPFLENGLSQYLNVFETEPNAAMWTQSDLAIRLFVLLSNEQLIEAPVMQPIKKYLTSQNNELLISRKKWQLAHRLAVLFISYELQRPEMVMLWLAGKYMFNNSLDRHLTGLEQAEGFLYQQLHATNKQAASHSLFQRFQRIDWKQQQVVDQQMHVFTPSRLSAFHRHVVTHMAQYMRINIYQLNVCCEYWEDMTTDAEDAWMKNILSQPVWVKNQDGIVLDEVPEHDQELFIDLDDDHAENPLLKAWAKPGRESLRLFSQMEDDAIHLNVIFDPEWVAGNDSRGDHALHRIQDAILYREHAQSVLRHRNQLSSLQFAQAPSIHREVEAVFNSVVTNLRQNPNLKLTDIAILVTDMNRYRSVIEQVFAEMDKQLPFQLSYSLIDSTAKSASRYAQAVLGLFDLLEHNFFRANVLKWLANDCVKQALGLSDEVLSDWLDWCTELGIYSGFEELYESSGSTGLSKRFTWQQGLKRMRLSLVSSNTAALTQDVESLGGLAWIVESLFRWHQQLQKPMTAAEWQQQLSHMLSTFITVPSDLYKEEQVKLALNDSVQQLVQYSGEMNISFADMRQFIEQELTQLSASKGNYLSGGIICAALQPMRPIPFKVTYVLGLDERTFPGDWYQETLDLTQRNRRLGDINKTENMNYLFLETLMCTREKLYLSYVGHDLIKDESILPSSTWQQLRDYASSLIDVKSLDLQSYPVTSVPLDAVSLSAQLPSALDTDWLTNHVPADHRIAQLKFAQVSDQVDAVSTATMPVKGTVNGQPIVTARDVQVSALARFLENPVLSYLDQLGGSQQLIDDELNIEHEPFALDGLSKYQLFDAAVADYLNHINQDDDISLATAIQQQYDEMASQSQLPIQLFADLDSLCALEQHKSFQILQTELLSLDALPGPVVFGDSWYNKKPAQKLPATTLVADGEQWQLHGSWHGLYSQDGLISHQVVVTSSSATPWHKILIKPFLCWCQAQLDEQIAISEDFQLYVVFSNQVNSYRFRPWMHVAYGFSSSDQIKNYLERLLQSFQTPDPVNLPFEVLSGLTVSTHDREQVIPYLKAGSRAKSAHVFAYDQQQMSEHELAKIQEQYTEKAHAWLDRHDYYEMLKALTLQLDPGALSTYRQRLLPLHVMVGAQLP